MADDHLTPVQRAEVTDTLVLRVVAQIEGHDEGTPINSSILASVLGVYDGTTHPVIRAAIGEALRRGLAPICANARGYFVAQNDLDVRYYADELEHRAEAIAARASNVRRAWKVRQGHEAPAAQVEAPHWVPDPEERA
jgi:hypothetical protein